VPDSVPALPDRFHQALSQLVNLLETRNVPYMIVGAIAAAIWGRPRATADIDVTVLADTAGLEAIAEQAASFGFVVDHQWLEWQPLLRGFQVRLTRAGVIVDIMRPRDRHEEAAFDRRRPIAIEGRRLWFTAPDDLILMKLKAGRPRDFEDAIGVLAAQRGVLDEVYMADWARQTGVAEELSYVLTEGTR
jgi:hypothetical protein